MSSQPGTSGHELNAQPWQNSDFIIIVRRMADGHDRRIIVDRHDTDDLDFITAPKVPAVSHSNEIGGLTKTESCENADSGSKRERYTVQQKSVTWVAVTVTRGDGASAGKIACKPIDVDKSLNGYRI